MTVKFPCESHAAMGVLSRTRWLGSQSRRGSGSGVGSIIFAHAAYFDSASKRDGHVCHHVFKRRKEPMPANANRSFAGTAIFSAAQHRQSVQRHKARLGWRRRNNTSSHLYSSLTELVDY